jgi:hypothetical protein
LKSFRKLLAHAREILELDIGFRLWDGSTVPDDLDPAAFAIRFADEGVIASLLRSPNPETLLNLWVSKPDRPGKWRHVRSGGAPAEGSHPRDPQAGQQVPGA